jgi:hypothetical protein
LDRGVLMRFVAIPLALLLGFAAPAYAADLEPMPTKAPPMEAPAPFEPGPGWALLLVPIAVCVALCGQGGGQGPHSP